MSDKENDMAEEKLTLTGLVRDDPKTPEGKYLVLRRDGTVPPWPSFVLGGADPFAEKALLAYANAVADFIEEVGEEAAKAKGVTKQWCLALFRLVGIFSRWRAEHGEGDPGKGIHRKDCPWVIQLMKLGYSA